MEKPTNYMFHGNLETIKRMVDGLVQMDPEEISQILSDGHDWAEDHIATSLDDIQEVYNFLKSRSSVGMNHNHGDHRGHKHEPIYQPGLKKDMDDFLQSFESFTFKG